MLEAALIPGGVYDGVFMVLKKQMPESTGINSGKITKNREKVKRFIVEIIKISTIDQFFTYSGLLMRKM